MAKRRVKKRTHVGAKAQTTANGTGKAMDRSPKSMVIRVGAGDIGPSVSQLVKDVRAMMEPGTATRLRERKSNKLRDYTTMAGPLGVTHLMLFSRSTSGNTNLRLAITPRGPTLHFRVSKYSLCKDVQRSTKRPTSGAVGHLTPPLLVMNNFMSPETDKDAQSATPKHLESLCTTIFQSLFPPISPHHASLSSIKRVLLLDRVPSSKTDDDAPYVLQLRHYTITTQAAKSAMPKALRRLQNASDHSQARKRKLPNLGRLNDVSDYLLDPSAGSGFTSGSDSEAETDAEVEVLQRDPKKVLSREARQRLRDNAAAQENDSVDREATIPAPRPQANHVEKKAIKLSEIGPRLTLRLTKVEEGLCGGKVMWHEYIHKTQAEVKKMDQTWTKRREERDERRRIQKENLDKKRKERGSTNDEDEDDEMEGVDDDYDDDMWDEMEGDEDQDMAETEDLAAGAASY